MWATSSEGSRASGVASSQRAAILARGVGIGLVAVGGLLAELPHGGLAPIVVAAVVAAALGAPAGLAEWRTSLTGGHAAVRAAADGLSEVLGLGLAAVALSAVGSVGWLPLLGALAAWPAAAWAARAPGATATVAGGALLLAVGLAVAPLTPPPWSLLDPRWSEASTWLPPAVCAGVWLSGAGTGQWVSGPDRPAGAIRAPLGVAGFALLAVVAFGVAEAAAFEGSLGASAGGVVAALVLGIALLAPAAAVLGRTRVAVTPPWARPLAGAALTLVLAGPAGGARAALLHTVFPALAAASLGITALHAQGADRYVAGAAAAALLLAGVAAGDFLPPSVPEAVWLGLVLTAGFWYVATQIALARRPA